MAAKFRYKADIDDQGNLAKIHSIRGFKQDLKLFSGQSIWIEFSKFTKTRSGSQNAYYHSCVIPAVMEGLINNGYEAYKIDKEVVHDFLKDKFIKEEITSQETGEVLQIPRSTSSLSTTEFMDYIANIQQWAATYLSVIIPDPGDQSFLKFD